MRGRKLKDWEALRFMEDQRDGFIVNKNNLKYTWDELTGDYEIGRLVSSDWYEYIKDPKPKTLAERYSENYELGNYICEVKEWLEQQPENKPRIDILEKFESHFMSTGERKVRCTERDDVIAEMWEFLKVMI